MPNEQIVFLAVVVGCVVLVEIAIGALRSLSSKRPRRQEPQPAVEARAPNRYWFGTYHFVEWSGNDKETSERYCIMGVFACEGRVKVKTLFWTDTEESALWLMREFDSKVK